MAIVGTLSVVWRCQFLFINRSPLYSYSCNSSQSTVLYSTIVPLNIWRTKEALYTRMETAVCICPSSGGGRFEYFT